MIRASGLSDLRRSTSHADDPRHVRSDASRTQLVVFVLTLTLVACGTAADQGAVAGTDSDGQVVVEADGAIPVEVDVAPITDSEYVNGLCALTSLVPDADDPLGSMIAAIRDIETTDPVAGAERDRIVALLQSHDASFDEEPDFAPMYEVAAIMAARC